MKPKTIVHFEIPHPFNIHQKCLVTSQEKAKMAYQKAFNVFHAGHRTFILHEIQSFAPDDATSKRCQIHIQKLFNRWFSEYQDTLGKDIIQVVVFILLSYAIWNIAFIAHIVDSLFVLMGDYLNTYARVILILSPLIYMVYRKLLIGDTITSHLRNFRFLKIKTYLDFPPSDTLYKDLMVLYRNIQNQEVRGTLQAIMEALKGKKRELISTSLPRLWEILNSASLSWKEEELLRSFLQEMETFKTCDFQLEGFVVKSNSALTEFFSSSFYREWSSTMEGILQEFRLHPTSEKAQNIAQMLLQLERKLRTELATQWEEKYLQILIDSYRELSLSFSSLKKREPLPTLPEVDPSFPWKRKSFLTLGRATGLVLSITAGALFLFSLHLVNQEDFLIQRSFVPGWQGMWGEKVTIIEEGVNLGKKKLLLSIPRPFAASHRVTCAPQNVQVKFILKEVEPSFQGGVIGTIRYLWDKGMAFFKEGYGNDFIVLEGNISFQVLNPEQWKNYDFDGLGKERLERDLENYLTAYFEELQGTYRENLFTEDPDKVQEYLVATSKSRNFKTWIRRFLYPSPLDTYRVGSVYDMYLVGLEWLLRHPRMSRNSEWQEFVEHEREIIKEKIHQEHDALIANPLKIRQMFRKPNLFDFADYPGLYQTLLLMAVTEITNNRLIEDLKNPEKIGNMNQDALFYLQNKKASFLSNVGITVQSITLGLGRVSYLHYVRQLQRRQNLL